MNMYDCCGWTRRGVVGGSEPCEASWKYPLTRLPDLECPGEGQRSPLLKFLVQLVLGGGGPESCLSCLWPLADPTRRLLARFLLLPCVQFSSTR